MALLPDNCLNISALMGCAEAGLPFSPGPRSGVQLRQSSGVHRFAINGVRTVFNPGNDVPGPVYVGRCAMNNAQELVGFQGYVILVLDRLRRRSNWLCYVLGESGQRGILKRSSL